MKTGKIAFLFFVVVAIADALYLSIQHFYPGVLACPNVGIIDCATVLSSNYSVVFGIPIAVLGLFWAVVMLLLFAKRGNVSAFLAPIWYLIGIIAVAYSFSAQYLIGKICIYCTTLDISIVAIVLLGIFAVKLHKE
jgi:uncharacterized membrane protein